MANTPSIIFIAPQLQQPRVIKRITTVYNAGYSIKVYGFDSGIFSNNLKSIEFPITEVIKRDKRDSRLEKAMCFIKTLRRIKKENRKDDVFYIFGAEMGNFSWILRNRKTIYEEADIFGAYFSNPLMRNIFRFIDRRTIGRSLLTIFTSEGFVDYTFRKRKSEKVLVIPNKLNNKFFNACRKKNVVPSEIDINHIKFGFVGIIRYPNTIVRFAEVIGREFPQHEFHFYGAPDVPRFLDSVENMNNVYIHGPFVNPIELPSIYSQIDIVISCYDTNSWNVRVAEPNKLYEAIFFETPIVVSKGTFLEKQVEKYNAGYAINADDDQSIIDFVKSIKANDLKYFVNEVSQVPWTNLIDDTRLFLDRMKSVIMK